VTLGECDDGDVVEMLDGERVLVSFRQPLDRPEAVFVRVLDPIDGTRSDPRPRPASTVIAEVVERAPGRARDVGGEVLDPVVHGSRRQGSLV
jgi:hypothetical protein